MNSWQSIFVQNLDPSAATERIHASLTNAGWRLYDPFAGLGVSYPRRIGSFVAPAQGAWLRVVLESTLKDAVPLVQALSETDGLALLARLETSVLTLHAYQAGKALKDLRDALPADVNTETMIQALTGDPPPLPPLYSVPQVGGVALADAPEALRRMSANVPVQQVGRLFERIARSVLSREQEAGARDLLRKSEGPDWQSLGGLTLRHVLNTLSVPPGWHTPDFATLRLAYTLHLRRQRQPHAPLLPGDAEALAAVPAALEYRPIYAGKDAAS